MKVETKVALLAAVLAFGGAIAGEVVGGTLSLDQDLALRRIEAYGNLIASCGQRESFYKDAAAYINYGERYAMAILVADSNVKRSMHRFQLSVSFHYDFLNTLSEGEAAAWKTAATRLRDSGKITRGGYAIPEDIINDAGNALGSPAAKDMLAASAENMRRSHDTMVQSMRRSLGFE